MGKNRRTVPGLNGSSMADISFTLLIFFLVTTSMDTDRGLVTRLPEPPDENMQEDDVKIKERNMFVVNINMNNEIFIGGGRNIVIKDISELKPLVKEFIANPNNDADKPDKWPVELPDPLGVQMITKNHVVSLQTDRAAKYDLYFQIYNELKAAYNELRDEFARGRFGKAYNDCTEDQQLAINQFYPVKISEAEARKYGGKR